MREARKTQDTLRETWLDLDHAKELAAMSRVLDDNPTIAELVWQDLRAASGSTSATRGAGGLSAEQVLRILVVKQMNGFSYRELAFHLADSRSYRTFCHLGITDKVPTKSALNANLKALQPATLEAINRVFIGAAQKAKVETGRTVRTDCTVVESNIHEPMDSELLWDCVRVLIRLLGRARDVLGPTQVVFGDRTRRAKRRRKEIFNAKKSEDRQRAYRDLLEVTAEVYGHGLAVRELLRDAEVLNRLGLWEGLVAQGVANDLDRFLPLTPRVMDQTRRRVLRGESVPAGEKIVSIFEEHTDIIRKDNRETLYGHKICLTGGASSMILDCKVLEGNPADSTLAKTMVERQAEIFARPPRQIVFDGGFASKMNLSEIKEMEVQDVAFSKGRGLGDRRHGEKQLGVQAAAGLSSRDRRQHLVSETDLWVGSLHLEIVVVLPELCLGLDPQLQPLGLRSAPAELRPESRLLPSVEPLATAVWLCLPAGRPRKAKRPVLRAITAPPSRPSRTWAHRPSQYASILRKSSPGKYLFLDRN